MQNVIVPRRFAIRNTDNTNVGIITRSLFSYFSIAECIRIWSHRYFGLSGRFTILSRGHYATWSSRPLLGAMWPALPAAPPGWGDCRACGKSWWANGIILRWNCAREVYGLGQASGSNGSSGLQGTWYAMALPENFKMWATATLVDYTVFPSWARTAVSALPSSGLWCRHAELI